MPEHAVLFTRRLPDAVERRAARDYRLIANPEDRPLSAEEIVSGARTRTRFVCCVADRMTAAVFSPSRTGAHRGQLRSGDGTPRPRGGEGPRRRGDQHPGGAHRRHCGGRPPPAPRRGSPGQRGSGDAALGPLDRMDAHAAHGTPAQRQAPGHRGDGAHRAGDGPAGARLRGGDPLHRPAPPAAREGGGGRLPSHGRGAAPSVAAALGPRALHARDAAPARRATARPAPPRGDCGEHRARRPGGRRGAHRGSPLGPGGSRGAGRLSGRAGGAPRLPHPGEHLRPSSHGKRHHRDARGDGLPRAGHVDAVLSGGTAGDRVA